MFDRIRYIVGVRIKYEDLETWLPYLGESIKPHIQIFIDDLKAGKIENINRYRFSSGTTDENHELAVFNWINLTNLTDLTKCVCYVGIFIKSIKVDNLIDNADNAIDISTINEMSKRFVMLSNNLDCQVKTWILPPMCSNCYMRDY